ncbi:MULTISPECIES: hypothetical protein [Butyricimonas]|uniref:hypothetical protein n=1 Tax=Butyricimonas TaxID=574697 RepID=UPI002431EEED|nr:hypothetical protein [Butyricimonas paravirosa]
MKRIIYCKLINVIIALTAVTLSQAQTIIAPTSSKGSTSFAIITDQKTWQKCQPEILHYRDVLEQEQLRTYIFADDWKKPEQIREILFKLYQEQQLEGAVFIGEIPIPMIRKAQHMTSAFKMVESRYPMRESSVPSDRFYDDFDLKFDFLQQDSLNSQMFYYDLSALSPQRIRCDIYTGRIKPIITSELDPYQQIRDYLTKAVAAHQEANLLDRFVSYTGHGSYSNSLTAWRAEQQTLREQIPGVFNKMNNARFMRYSMWDYPKDELISTLKQKDLDMMIFHEHGTPDRQYLSATPSTHDYEQHMEILKREVRIKLRQDVRNDKNYQDQLEKWSEQFQVDTSWWKGVNAPEQIVKDSLTDVHMGIILEDIFPIAPNARFVIFDACYNGDFRENDYIAGRYIFSPGKCVVAFGNSVNVLQDKSANDLFGLLGLGARLGFWARYTNILESHILGDPTFYFKSPVDSIRCNEWLGVPQTPDFWYSLLKNTSYADIQNISLIKLYHAEYPGISDTLRYYFENSPYAVVRYNCMTLLEEINDENFREVLKQATTDCYEFIRRIAIHRMGRVGSLEFLPYIIKSYINDYFSERVVFNTQMSLSLYRWEDVKAEAEKILARSSILNKQRILEKLETLLKNERQYKATQDMLKPDISENRKMSEIRYLKNANYHPGIPVYLSIVRDVNASPTIRQGLLESLAWFSLSEQKGAIVEVCKELMQDMKQDTRIRQEAERTYYRLTEQIKNR